MSSGFSSPLSVHLDAERASSRCLSNDCVHGAESEQKSPCQAGRTSGEVKEYPPTTPSYSHLYTIEHQDITYFLQILISRSLGTPESVVLLQVFVRRIIAMNGGANSMDVKLKQNPLVVVVKIEELKQKCNESNSILVNEQNLKNVDEEKIKFLWNFGLIPIENLRKHSSNSPKPIARRCRSSVSSNRPTSARQCCLGLDFHPRNKLPTRKSWHKEISANSCCEEKESIQRQLKLNPRICLKKWLGGERVVNTKRDFEILENDLIPKTDNHSYCKEKPKKCLSPLNCSTGSIPRKITSLDKESSLTSSECMDGCAVKIHSDINLRKNHFHLLRSHSHLPNGLRPPGMLSTNENEGRGSHSDSCYQKSYGVSAKIKEVQICVKKWQGGGIIDVSKDKRKIEDLLAVPPGISHRACRKAKVLEKSLNAAK